MLVNDNDNESGNDSDNESDNDNDEGETALEVGRVRTSETCSIRMAEVGRSLIQLLL